MIDRWRPPEDELLRFRDEVSKPVGFLALGRLMPTMGDPTPTRGRFLMSATQSVLVYGTVV